MTDPRGLITTTEYTSRNLVDNVKLTNFWDAPGGPARSITIRSYTYKPTLPLVDVETDAVGRQVQSTWRTDDLLQQRTLLNYSPLTGGTRSMVLGYYEYDNVGNVTLERRGDAANGVATTTRQFDANNFVFQQTQVETNRETTFTNDFEGRLKSATTGAYVESSTYNATTLLVSSTSKPGLTAGGPLAVTSYGYDQWGRRTTVTDPRSNVTTLTYDLADRVLTAKSPAFTAWNATGTTSASAQAVVTSGYDTFGSTSHTKDPRNLTTTTTFDTYGRPSLVTYPTNATVTPTESFTYDLADNPLTMVDRRGFTTTNVFDAMNRKRRTTQPIPATGGTAPVTLWDFNDVGETTLVTDPNLNKTASTFDTAGRLRTSTAGFGSTVAATTTYDYDDVNNRTYVKDPMNNVTTASFNATGQPVSMTDATGASTNYTYLASTGWTETVTVAGARRTKFEYDPAGRLSFEKRTNPAGTVDIAITGFGYDLAGNRTSILRPNAASDTFTYDSVNRLLTSVTDIGLGATAATAISEAGYDIAGNMVRVKDAKTNVTTTEYNNWGLPAKVVEPSTTAHSTAANRQWTVTYNAAGVPVSEVRPGAVTVTKTYDNLNRLTGETGTGTGAVSATRTFGYDQGGRVTSVGSQTISYDARNNVTGASGPQGTSTYVFDLADRMTSRTDAAGTSTFGWSGRSELKTITTNSTLTSYDWLPSGELDQVTYPGATSRKYVYDDLGRPVTDTVKNSAATVISSRAYEYNEDSTVKKTTVTQPGNTAAGIYQYSYDRGGRLRSMTAPNSTVTAYTYDAAGNRLTAGANTYTYDQRNRLLTGAGTTYNWSPRGTLTSTTGTGAATYTHDGLDRLTQAGTVTYAYDSLDRVTTRTVGGVATAFSYAGVEMDPVAEGTTTKYLRGPSGQSVHGIIRNGTMTIAGADRHGDVSFTLSTTGAVTDTSIVDPFGKSLGTTGTKPNIGFQSDYTDPTNGLVWMGARWYNPNTATFTARDTMPGSVGAYATMNRYTYGLNNPLTYSDPTGRYAAEVDGGGNPNVGVTDCDNACQYATLLATGTLRPEADNSNNNSFQQRDQVTLVDLSVFPIGDLVGFVGGATGLTAPTTAGPIATALPKPDVDKPGSVGLDECDPLDTSSFRADIESCEPEDRGLVDGVTSFGPSRKKPKTDANAGRVRGTLVNSSNTAKHCPCKVEIWNLKIRKRAGWGKFSIRAFIATEKSGCLQLNNCHAGDNRQFDPNATCDMSRACIEIDFEAGTIRIEVNCSHHPGRECKDPDVERNFMELTEDTFSDGLSGLSVRYDIVNPLAPNVFGVRAPAIDGRWRFRDRGDSGIQVEFDGDAYPSWEVYASQSTGGLLEVFTFTESAAKGGLPGGLVPGWPDRNESVLVAKNR